MIDSDQRPDSNRHPLLKSASTDVIISNQHPLTSLSQIGIHWRHYLKSASTDVIISNQHPLMSLSQISIHWHHYLKSASTDVIISNRHPLTSLSQICILSKFSDLWPIYWLGLGLVHMSVTSLDVDLRNWETAIDLRI
jgi:hypothetical protein